MTESVPCKKSRLQVSIACSRFCCLEASDKGPKISLPPCHESGGQVLSAHATTTHISYLGIKDTCTTNDRCLQYIYFCHAYMLVPSTLPRVTTQPATALHRHMPYIMARNLMPVTPDCFTVVKWGYVGQAWPRLTIP